MAWHGSGHMIAFRVDKNFETGKSCFGWPRLPRRAGVAAYYCRRRDDGREGGREAASQPHYICTCDEERESVGGGVVGSRIRGSETFFFLVSVVGTGTGFDCVSFSSLARMDGWTDGCLPFVFPFLLALTWHGILVSSSSVLFCSSPASTYLPTYLPLFAAPHQSIRSDPIRSVQCSRDWNWGNHILFTHSSLSFLFS